jgi:hypothetical protein
MKADFSAIIQPDTLYVAQTTLLDLSGPDYSALSALTSSSFSTSFSSPLEVRSVPDSWEVWNSSPATETSNPRVGYTNGASSLQITFSSGVKTFGFEAEPDNYTTEAMEAIFYSGDAEVGTLNLSPNGNGGALLFAATTSTDPFTKVAVFNLEGDDFAMGRERFSDESLAQTPEPGSVTLSLIAGLVCVLFRFRPVKAKYWASRLLFRQVGSL